MKKEVGKNPDNSGSEVLSLDEVVSKSIELLISGKKSILINGFGINLDLCLSAIASNFNSITIDASEIDTFEGLKKALFLLNLYDDFDENKDLFAEEESSLVFTNLLFNYFRIVSKHK